MQVRDNLHDIIVNVWRYHFKCIIDVVNYLEKRKYVKAFQKWLYDDRNRRMHFDLVLVLEVYELPLLLVLG